MLGAIIWWFAGARKWFEGPKVNIDHQMLGREGAVLEGKPALGSDKLTPSSSREDHNKKVDGLA